MEPLAGAGKMLMLVGLALLVVGGLLVAFGRSADGPLSWLGRLPGDVLIKRDNFTFYFPLATGLLLSVILTVLAWVFFRR